MWAAASPLAVSSSKPPSGRNAQRRPQGVPAVPTAVHQIGRPSPIADVQSAGHGPGRDRGFRPYRTAERPAQRE